MKVKQISKTKAEKTIREVFELPFFEIDKLDCKFPMDEDEFWKALNWVGDQLNKSIELVQIDQLPF